MNRRSLLAAVEFSSKAIGAKLPILECVHLKGDGTRLTVTATTLDLWARQEMDSDLVIDCCVPAKRFKKILDNHTADEVDLVVSPDMLTVLAPDAAQRAECQTLPGADFPPVAEAQGERFPIPGAALKQMMPAVCQDSARYALCSVYFDPKGFVVGTDGHRMHSSKAECACEMVLPSAAAELLVGTTGELRAKGGRFTATGDDWSIGGKLIEGAYPNWRQVKPGPRKCIPLPKGFAEALERVRDGNTDQYGTVTISPDGLYADGWREDLKTKLPTVKVNAAYLLDMLKAAGEGAKISVIDDVQPVVVEAGDFYGCLMPMRITQ